MAFALAESDADAKLILVNDRKFPRVLDSLGLSPLAGLDFLTSPSVWQEQWVLHLNCGQRRKNLPVGHSEQRDGRERPLADGRWQTTVRGPVRGLRFEGWRQHGRTEPELDAYDRLCQQRHCSLRLYTTLKHGSPTPSQAQASKRSPSHGRS